MSTYVWIGVGVCVAYLLWLQIFGKLGFWRELARHPDLALGFIQADPAWRAGVMLPHPGDGWQGPYKMAVRGQIYSLYFQSSDPNAQARILERIRLIHPN